MKTDTNYTEQNQAQQLITITAIIAESWDKIAELKGLTELFATAGEDSVDAAKFNDIVQELIDAYLVYIGQLEAMLTEVDFLDPVDPVDSVPAKVFPEEPVEENTTDVEEEGQGKGIAVKAPLAAEFAEEPLNKNLAVGEDSKNSDISLDKETVKEPFEYWADFD